MRSMQVRFNMGSVCYIGSVCGIRSSEIALGLGGLKFCPSLGPSCKDDLVFGRVSGRKLDPNMQHQEFCLPMTCVESQQTMTCNDQALNPVLQTSVLA